jgi:hypothetical protein
VDLYTIMCRILFLETFRVNVGVPDFSLKNLFEKNCTFEKIQKCEVFQNNLRDKNEKRA